MKHPTTWLTAALFLAACQPTSAPPEETPLASDAPAPRAPVGAAAPARAQADAAAAAVPPPPTLAPGDADTNAAIDQALGDHARYESFIREFQSAVVRGDQEAVAGMVDYPFRATVDGKAKTIGDAAAFIADYGKILTPEIVQVVRNQKYADLFASYRGVMFGDGQVWINGICHHDSPDCAKFDVRVVTIQPGPDR